MKGATMLPFTTTDTPVTAEAVMVKLSEGQYKALVRMCPQPVLNPDSNANAAAFALGVQFVLQRLRDGFVS
jgi:hypothetical protein